MDDLSGRVAVVTGGASGIGLGLAQALLAAGMKVAIADINQPALAEAAASLGANAMPVVLDITSATAWHAALDAVEAKLGPIALLCNNAGLGQGRRADGGPVLMADMPEEVWKLVIDTNLHGRPKCLETISILGFALLDEAKTLSKNLASILITAAGNQVLDQRGLMVCEHDIARGHIDAVQNLSLGLRSKHSMSHLSFNAVYGT